MSTILEVPVAPEKRTKQALLSWRDSIFSAYEKHQLKKKLFVIISNNCWGYELYGATQREYNTPFIGLFMMPDCYLQFLENFEACLVEEIRFTSQSKYYSQPKAYPIGVLGSGIEIHFLHYRSEKEAQEKWSRRVSRLKLALVSGAQLFVKMCDCEGCTSEQLARFHALSFKYKLSIGLQNFTHLHHLQVPKLRSTTNNNLIDGARLFKKRYSYFDITQWIRKGDIKKTSVSRIFSLMS